MKTKVEKVRVERKKTTYKITTEFFKFHVVVFRIEGVPRGFELRIVRNLPIEILNNIENTVYIYIENDTAKLEYSLTQPNPETVDYLKIVIDDFNKYITGGDFLNVIKEILSDVA